MRFITISTVLLAACSGDTEKSNGNSAPEIQFLTITGETFSTSDTLMCSVEYVDRDDDVVTENYEWSNQSGDIIGSTNTIDLQVGVVEPDEMVNCMVTLDDGTVSVSEITSATITNTNPTVDTIAIDPSTNITPESTLTCSATASDLDGGTPTLNFAWERDGQSLASTEVLSLSIVEDTAMGDTFTCTATALDVHGGEGTKSASVTVGNSPPTMDDVQIIVASNPALSFTSQLDLECIANGLSDPNDDVVTLSYQWFINGTLQTDVSTAVLSAPFSVEDEIGCHITPNDGFDDGDTLEASIVIPNTNPEIFSVEIDPNTDVEANNTLTCLVDAFDADDGVLVGQYEWLDGDGNSAGVGDTLILDPIQNRPDDEITCIARVADNNGANTEFQSSIWIMNTEPVVNNSASITSSPTPTSTAVLTCAAGFTDLNDGILTPTYNWTLSDGTILSGNGSTYTINPAENNPTDTVVCTASTIDGNGASVETTTSVVIENTAPSIDAFSISPSTNVEANVTLEMIHSISDIDAETLTVDFSWTDDNGIILGTGSTLTLSNTRPVGSSIMATLTVNDAYGGSDTISETVDILNTLPLVDTPASISANPDSVTTGVLTCSAAFSDYNDGPLTPTYTWTLSDGTPLASVGNTLTIDANTTNPTEEIVCTASATDNDGASIESSTSIVIENTNPTVDSFSITPGNSVEANVTLEMVYTTSDLDSETLTTSFEWVDNTGSILGSGNTLTLDNARPVGSSIVATLTVNDAYGGSDTVSESISIVNSEPVLDQSAILTSSPSPKTTGILTCSAAFSDYNDGPLTPVYTWTLSDGTFLSSNASTYTISESQTNPGEEIVCTATAIDNDGASIESSTSIVIENTNPTVDAFAIAPDTNVEANTTLEMQVSFSDIDNQGLNPTYEWSSAQGSLLSSSNLLPLNSTYTVGATITGTFTVTDINGGVATQSDVVTILNTNPTVSSPASIIATPTPTTTSTLTCSAGFSDYNDGSLTPTYTWTLSDGTPLASVGNTLTIDANTTNPTEEIVCTASATDNDGASIESSTSIVIENTNPSIDSFSIIPGNSVEANVTLEMILSISDIDNDVLSIQYSWLNSGGQSLGSGSTLTLDSSYSVGSTITAIATLTDTYGATDVNNQVVTILNTTPQVANGALITATPSAVTTGVLSCSASFTDFNDGTLSPTYTWSVGGTTIGSGNSYTIDANDVSPTDIIQCEASATDTNGSTVTSVASIGVQNTSPSVDSVTISPTTAYVDSTITCAYSASDIDSGETQTASYSWSRNGANEGGTGSTYAGGLSVGDIIGCTVQVTDNFGGTDNESALLTIGNRAPTVTNINLPSTVDSQTDITAIVTSNDPDGQSVILNYAWYKSDDSNGGSIVSIGTNSATLAASQFDKHDEVFVEVTPTDGNLSGIAVTSSSVIVVNTAPTTPVVTISPSITTAYVGADLTCSVSTPSTDLDGDTVTYHFKWYNPGGGLESDILTNSTVDEYLGANVDQAGTWTCTVTPMDDDTSGGSASDTVSVQGLESCLDYSNAGQGVDGVYTLYISGVEVNAYCDMNTDGGGWTLFAITTSSQCAENLPYGGNELTNITGTAYITTLFKNTNHTEFLQDFRANGVNTTFDIIYNFTDTKTVSQRFDNAVSSGESVNWIVYYGFSSFLYSGTWRYSNAAGTSGKWNSSGSNFSNDDGIWGAQSGQLDGDSPGPYLGNSGWGHQNNNSGDGNCSTYFYNGTNTVSSNIKNLMYFR